jgi:N-carbamoylputrescine amidase
LGQILVQAPDDAEAVLTAEVDLAAIEATRRYWPFLRDRRIDAYGPILQRWLDGSTAGPIEEQPPR